MSPFRTDLKARLIDGIGLGITLAAIYSVIALIIFAIRGATSFTRINISLPGAIGLYFASGIMAGTVAGLLGPFTKRLIGAMAVGIIAAAAPAFIATVAVSPPDASLDLLIATTSIGAVFFGSMFGWAFWSLAREERERLAKLGFPE